MTWKKKKMMGAMLVVAGWVGTTLTVVAQQPSGGERAVRYASNGDLLKPADFREWVFLSAGLGMTYTEPGATPNPSPSFTNVYVNPSAYREFMKTGTWPDLTMFILEIRGSASEGSINLGGRYQTGIRAIEAEVKDGSKPGGWAFYNFGAKLDQVAALPKTERCYECHSTKAAVEQTFVQFYPTLLDVARQKGTLNAAYLAAEKAHP